MEIVFYILSWAAIIIGSVFCVIGTINTDKVATAMIVREDRLTATVLATMTHP